MSSHSNWIRTMRDQLGLSSYELARRAGVSQPMVMHWERRERAGTITLATLRKAATALGCECTYTLIPKQSAPISVPKRKPKPRPPSKAKPTARPHRSLDPNEIWGG
jgi:transcriptional regulator with XRE-family HTH domain